MTKEKTLPNDKYTEQAMAIATAIADGDYQLAFSLVPNTREWRQVICSWIEKLPPLNVMRDCIGWN